MLTDIKSPGDDSVEPVVVGQLYLALQDDCYYRAEVGSVSPDGEA